MEILTTYNNDTLQLITDSENSYFIPNFWEYYVDSYFDLKDAWDNVFIKDDSGVLEPYYPVDPDEVLTSSQKATNYWVELGVTDKESFGQIHWELYHDAEGRGYPKIKLSVFSDAGSFLQSDDLIKNTDFYISQNQLFLKPNEYLDREGFSENNYNLQFDFIQRFRENNELYISEISPSRKEIRLTVDTKIFTDGLDNNYINQITAFLNGGLIEGTYQFNSYLELSQGRLIPINSYALDRITGGKNSFILKLNQPLSANIQTLNKDFRIANKFLSSQTETVFFRDVEQLAISGLGLEIDEGFTTEDIFDEDIDYSNYQSMTSSFGEDIFAEIKRQKKDINLNIDYSKFSNHAFFGSAESKLKNFKDKAVKLEGLYTEISSSLSFTSSKNIIDKRKDLFKQVKTIKDDFTRYEYFLYNDSQTYSSASAPGIGTNLAGTDFSNKYNNSLTKIINSEGFDTVYKKTAVQNTYLHLFTDVYNAEDPPFYNTNKAVYLSFIMKGYTGSYASPGSNFNVEQKGGHANINYDYKKK